MLYYFAPKWGQECKKDVKVFNKADDIFSFLYMSFHFIIAYGAVLLTRIIIPLFLVLYGISLVSPWFAPRFAMLVEKVGEIWGQPPEEHRSQAVETSAQKESRRSGAIRNVISGVIIVVVALSVGFGWKSGTEWPKIVLYGGLVVGGYTMCKGFRGFVVSS